MTEDSNNAIAIVGMGCRFPGADSPEAFWQLMQDRVDAISEVPPDRFDINPYYDPEQGKLGKTNSRAGGFVADIDKFDADFFGMAPREAVWVDPQQRLLLEVGWEALERAGMVLDDVQGSNTGVFVGISTYDYRDLQIEWGLAPSSYSGTGSAHSLAANRLSYVLDLHGPSFIVDTACSSSLIAIHLACQSLRHGECDAALAGGVNVITTPYWYLAFGQARMLSSDGRCQTFDAGANGYVRAEGCGVIALKRLSDALRDGDPIAAVIRGTASNQDGRSNGVTAPNGAAQQAVIRSALEDAGVAPSDIDYVEAHGTGTPLGDPIEVEALKSVLLDGRSADQQCIIGSSKTNIGHMEAAAGMAGIIRASLILQHGEVPPHLHLKQMNPQIHLEGTPFHVATEPAALPRNGRPLLAGVNGFGFGGANCHIVLEEAPAMAPASLDASGPQLLTLSAKTPEALEATAALYRRFIAEAGEALSLRDLCYSLSLHRTQFEERLAVAAGDFDEAIDALDTVLAGEERRGVARGRVAVEPGKIVFVLSGMGSQWLGMGRELLETEPVFRAAIERCDEAMSRYVPWSVLEELAADEDRSHLDDIGILQPILFAIGVALADLWRSWGVEPDAVVGHSVGEVSAACISGALSLDEAARIVCRRGEVLRAVSGMGAMLSVGLPREEVAPALEPYVGRASIGVVNSRTTTVVSGYPDAIEELAAHFKASGVFCRPVRADIAFHSPQMDGLRDAFREALRDLHPHDTDIPMYSTVTATRLAGHELDAEYWIRNLREPVAFGDAVELLLTDGYSTFIEVSPHSVLVHAIRECSEHSERPATTVPSMRRQEGERLVMLQSLGALWARGHAVSWDRLYADGGSQISLPTYAWQKERFWLDERQRSRNTARRTAGHPFLGEHVESAALGGKRVWQLEVDLDLFPYLADHRAGGSIIFPAAAYAETALAVGEAIGFERCVVDDFSLTQGMVLAPDETRTLQVVASTKSPTKAALEFYSLDGANGWVSHATLVLRRETSDQTPSRAAVDQETLEARFPETLNGAEHIDEMHRRDLHYGPAFQPIQRLNRQGNEAVASLTLPESVQSDKDTFHLHPSLLDGCLQAVASLVQVEAYLPVVI
jgi:acyl transferase domain-containing protein